MYKNYIFNTEYVLAIRLLEQARSSALSNEGQTSHGVRFESKNYITFQGNYYPGNDANQSYPQNSVGILEPQQVEFLQPGGGLSADRTITLTDGTRKKNIFINKAGRIDFE
jgi:hypothetical protein